MAVEGLGGGGSDDKGVAFLVSAGVMYEIIAAACSSPQTTELNAKARSETLMKWVHLGVAQGVLFVGLAAVYQPADAVPILVGGTLAGAILYWSYDYAKKSGLGSCEPPTEDYQNFGQAPSSAGAMAGMTAPAYYWQGPLVTPWGA